MENHEWLGSEKIILYFYLVFVGIFRSPISDSLFKLSLTISNKKQQPFIFLNGVLHLRSNCWVKDMRLPHFVGWNTNCKFINQL